MSEPKSEATFFKEEVEQLIGTRYGRMTVYETIGALEVVKLNLLEHLGRRPRHVIPLADSSTHTPSCDCLCAPLETESGLWVHNAHDGREKYERQDGKKRGGWEIVFE